MIIKKKGGGANTIKFNLLSTPPPISLFPPTSFTPPFPSFNPNPHSCS